MEGWIKLHRKIVDNPFYFAEPFTRSQAWIDMLLIANHKIGYIYKRGIKVIVYIGQIGYDLDSLAKRWKWSRGKATRFLNALENEGQIVRQKNNITSLITITNYSYYQSVSKAKRTANDTANGQQMIQQTDTNKNDKNDKNDKNTYGEFQNVLLTKSEFEKLQNEGLLTEIERLSEYIASKGAKYKNHYATIRMWKSREIKNENTKRTNGIRSSATAEPSPREAFTKENCKFN